MLTLIFLLKKKGTMPWFPDIILSSPKNMIIIRLNGLMSCRRNENKKAPVRELNRCHDKDKWRVNYFFSVRIKLTTAHLSSASAIFFLKLGISSRPSVVL